MAYALHNAARNGDLGALTQLIGQGCNVNQVGFPESTDKNVSRLWSASAYAYCPLVPAGLVVSQVSASLGFAEGQTSAYSHPFSSVGG